jgi:alkanesulfonate monooxygenase SsuD/methylene tetrahydromethanopterin reductase-like flavin-dependent oxidoreductase (luciferase family)
MDIGLIASLHGRPGADTPAPTWRSIRHLAVKAEAVGFDMMVFEDALLYRGEETSDGVWESVSIAGAIAEATARIRFGQSVINSPYRSPAMVASIATTLDEISGGRYVLGIGAGNTADSDYEAFGFPTDKRYSRFAEAIEIIHGMLKSGGIDHSGEFYSAKEAELVLRGPHRDGPPINIAAGGPKMLALVARYADAWNWWAYDETLEQIRERVGSIAATLDRACEAVARDPDSIDRTLDLYSVTPPDFDPTESGMEHTASGSAEEISHFILGLGDLGITEVRCDLSSGTSAAVEAMAGVVEAVHAG